MDESEVVFDTHPYVLIWRFDVVKQNLLTVAVVTEHNHSRRAGGVDRIDPRPIKLQQTHNSYQLLT